jgi:filamin
MEVINNHDRTWTINYIPNEVGETYIDILLGNELINGSPFKVNVFDVNQIHVSNTLGGIVGRLVKFDIDASKAGIGQLEIIVQDGQISCDAISRSSSQFDVIFVPNKCGLYKIDIRYNGLTIPGNSYKTK